MYKIPFSNDIEKIQIKRDAELLGAILLEEQYLFDGKFLVFDKDITMLQLEKENTLLKVQNTALTEQVDFHENVIAEIIVAIMP